MRNRALAVPLIAAWLFGATVAESQTAINFSFTGTQSTSSFNGSGSLDPYPGLTIVSLVFTGSMSPPTISFILSDGDTLSATGDASSFQGGADFVRDGATVTGGTGIFANATGTLHFTLAIGPSNTTLTGSGTITTNSTTGSSPFPIPGSPAGAGPEGDPSGVNCSSCGQPVTISNGNMYHQFTDLRLRSRGFPIALTRTYNSQAGVDSIFGTGWTHSYQRWLNPSGNSVVFYDGTGGAYTFTSQGNGTGFVSPAGVHLTLSTLSQGGFHLQTLHGGAMTFDASGRLTSLTDANGNAQTITYNSQGKIATLSDAIGESLTFNYDPNNHVTSLEDNTGRRVMYQYSNGNLISSTDPTGAVTMYGYSASGGLLETITLPDGGTINYTYGANNQVSRVVDREAAASAYTYSSAAQTVVQDELGRNTTFQFNPAGNVTKQIKPDTSTTTQTFDANTNVTSTTDEDGDATSYQYDANGNLVKVTNALGGMRSYAYDPVFNHLISLQDENGNTTQYQYDSKGNLTKITDPLGGQTTFTYDSFGNLLTRTDAGGATVSANYDTHGNVTAIKNPLNNSRQFTYDGLNRPVSVTDALGEKSSRAYDALGRVTQLTSALGQVITRSYDGVGNLIGVTDSAGRRTNFAYDHLGNLVRVTDPAGDFTSYAYSPGACNCATPGTLSSITNATGLSASFLFDSNDRVTSATDLTSAGSQLQYDAAGNITQTTDARGQATKYVRDKLRRVTQKQYQDGNSDFFIYDANGNLLTARNQNLTLNFTYDALNRVTSVADSRFSSPTTYTYDHVGRRLSMTDPFGGVTSYTYDATGELVKLVSPNGAIAQFTYDAAGRRNGIAMGNGIAGTYQYDAAGELVSVNYSAGAGPVAEFSYTYDASGNRATATTPAGISAYQYDLLDRLITAAHPVDPAESYVYDAVGNRVSTGQAPPVLNAGATSYTYNAASRLAGASLPNNSTVTYKYDPLGRRIEKSVGGVVTRYLYDGNHVLLEQDGSGAAFRVRYTFGPRLDEPLVMDTGAASYFYVADGAGNIVNLTNTTGAVVETYDYDSFGVLLSTASSGSVIPNSYLFSGKALDAETGLYYFQSRYYDPATGRFVSQDGMSPSVLLAGARVGSRAAGSALAGNLRSPLRLNSYAYVENNPINRRDAFGFIDYEIKLQQDQAEMQAELDEERAEIQSMQQLLMSMAQNMSEEAGDTDQGTNPQPGDVPGQLETDDGGIRQLQSCPLQSPGHSGTRGLYVAAQQQLPQLQQQAQQLSQGMPSITTIDPAQQGIDDPLLQQQLAINQQLQDEIIQARLELSRIQLVLVTISNMK